MSKNHYIFIAYTSFYDCNSFLAFKVYFDTISIMVESHR